MLKKNITDFLNNEYKGYVFYVLSERALPDIRDGLKTGARKIMHAAFKGAMRDGSPKKIPNLVGETFNYSLYPHGDVALAGTIVTLSQQFKFNFYPFYIDGQNGTLRTPKTSASPRYLYVQLSQYAQLWKTDIELVNYLEDEGQIIEPDAFYPIIPMTIINSQEGMAPGYKFSTMSYNPIDVIDLCLHLLSGKKDIPSDKNMNPMALWDNGISDYKLRPFIRGINESTWKFEDGSWVNYGEYVINKSKDTVHVTALPYDATYISFETILNKLIDKGTIKTYKDMSKDGNIDYLIQFPKKRLEVETKNGDQKIINMFKLKKIMPDDLLWVLDEHGKIRHFETPQLLTEYFVNWRLKIYSDRKKRLTKIMTDKYNKNCDMVRFIELVISGKLKIRNRVKADVIADMKAVNLASELLETSMSKITKDEHDKLLEENSAIKKDLDYINNTSEKEMYVNDLKQLKKMYKKDFE